MLNQSQFNLFLYCGEKYMHEYIRQTPPMYRSGPLFIGSVMHRFMDGDVEDEWPVKLKAIFADELGKDDPPLDPNLDHEKLFAAIFEMAEAYVLKFRGVPFDFHEVKWRGSVSGIPIYGTMDKLNCMGYEVPKIYEFKTGSLAMRTALDRDIQIGFYAWGVARGEVLLDGEWVRLGKIPEVYLINTKQLIPYKRSGKNYKKGDPKPGWETEVFITDKSLDKIEEVIPKVVRLMNTEIYLKTGDGYKCMSCEYLDSCEPYFDRDHSLQFSGIQDELEQKETEALNAKLRKKGNRDGRN